MPSLARSEATQAVDELARLYRTMTLVRQVENALSKLFSDGEVPGFIHLSVGQEAIAAGVAAAMKPQDTLLTTHRGHGHVLARGLDVTGFFKEIMGRAGGLCKGRGGSMHVADLSLGVLGANGIVGAGIPIALGSAMAHSVRGNDGVAVSFFGDGAMAEGVLHETMNMAALWSSPLLLVCENNGWSEFSPTARQFRPKLGSLAQAFGVAYEQVDGNDVAAVLNSARRCIQLCRTGSGPAVLECTTHRIRGHFEGDPQKYRNPEEFAPDDERDPVARARRALLAAGIAESSVEEIDEAARNSIVSAIESARSDPEPEFASALSDVYTSGDAA